MRKYISAHEVMDEWLKDPQHKAAYDALEGEFALANALIEARTHAYLTQEQVAAAMGTKQAALPGCKAAGRMPSTCTLERFAQATGTELRISFASRKSPKTPKTI